jgi:hypothetical protein
LTGLLFTNFKTTKPISKVWNERNFTIFETKDTINLKLTYFIKNSVYYFTEAISYALLIGQTNNSSSNISSTIMVLARCDNNNYTVGQILKVLPIQDPTNQTTLRPFYIVQGTLINNQKQRWLIGSENPTFWEGFYSTLRLPSSLAQVLQRIPCL